MADIIEWWKTAAVYQVYPKSFCGGTIDGICSKLDYIRGLSVDAVWLSPIYKSPMHDNGYDISDYRDIDPSFGTLEDFKRLLGAAHGLGLKIVMDLVVNHSSDEHPWFRASRASLDNPYRDYYIWRDLKPANWRDLFGGGDAWTLDEMTGQYYLHLFSEHQPDLNWENPKLRREVYDIMRYWLDMGVDGFRMDVISYISKPREFRDLDKDESVSDICANGERVHEFLREMNREVLSGYSIMTVGETPRVTVEEACKYASLGGEELSMVFHFEVNDLDGGESDKWTDRKINPKDFKDVWCKWQKGLAGKAWNSLYLSNHDQPRSVSRLGCDADEWRERSQKMLATCTYLMQGTVFIYQGEELGLKQAEFRMVGDLRDIEGINAYNMLMARGMGADDAMRLISKRGRDGARTAIPWELGTNSVYGYYKALLALRKRHRVFTDGAFIPVFEERGDVIGYLRGDEEETIVVMGNFTGETVRCPLGEAGIMPEEMFLGNVDDSEFVETGLLQPYETIVLRIKEI